MLSWEYQWGVAWQWHQLDCQGICYGLGCGKAMGCATAGVLVAVSAGRVAGVASLVFALTSPGSVVTSAQSLFASQLSSPLFAQCSKMV